MKRSGGALAAPGLAGGAGCFCNGRDKWRFLPPADFFVTVIRLS
jgi:hypothetical protein